MIRVALVVELRPEAPAELQRRAQQLWPELAGLLREHGVLDCTAWSDRRRGLLFAQLLVESRERWEAIAASPGYQRCWAQLKDVVAVAGDASPRAAELEEVVSLAPGSPQATAVAPAARPGRAPAAPAAAEGFPRIAAQDIERFFRTPELEALKQDICDIGRRLWQRAYVDGNGGNISIRVAEDLVLCTPTLVSKGFMKPEDLCLVDLEGNQKAGAKRRTSELLMHLAMYRAQPRARACVHAHPPHATGFAVSGVRPPNGMVPEMEVFCGVVPVAPYMTPGSKEMGAAVAALCDHHNTILMANHGVVAWGFNVEDAYFKMEIVESYCRTVLVTAQLGKDPSFIPPRQVKELLQIKERLGIPDPRHALPEGELRDGADWRPGVNTRAPAGAPAQADAEELVRQVTERILKALGK